jgi:hypothetical protein
MRKITSRDYKKPKLFMNKTKRLLLFFFSPQNPTTQLYVNQRSNIRELLKGRETPSHELLSMGLLGLKGYLASKKQWLST